MILDSFLFCWIYGSSFNTNNNQDTNQAGASNMLRFAGEDPRKQERTKMQQQQIIQWNDDQQRLKNQRLKAEKDADLYVLLPPP